MAKKSKTLYFWRHYFFLTLIVLFFVFLSLNPINISQYFGARFGSAVGMSISVPENPFNKLALQLREKEDRLNQKERQLAKREAELGVAQNQDQTFLLILLTAGIIVLFVLVIINYYLDFKRRRQLLQEQQKNRFG